MTANVFRILHKIQEITLTRRMNRPIQGIDRAKIGNSPTGSRNFNI